MKPMIVIVVSYAYKTRVKDWLSQRYDTNKVQKMEFC